jgi:hypothetical protein
VLRLVKAYDVADVKDYVKGPDFGKAARVIEPLTAIRNYKSQVPYPSDIAGTITCIIELRKTNVTRKDVLCRHYDTLTRLLGIGAFQLPTVSATHRQGAHGLVGFTPARAGGALVQYVRKIPPRFASKRSISTAPNLRPNFGVGNAKVGSQCSLHARRSVADRNRIPPLRRECVIVSLSTRSDSKQSPTSLQFSRAADKPYRRFL